MKYKYSHRVFSCPPRESSQGCSDNSPRVYPTSLAFKNNPTILLIISLRISHYFSTFFYMRPHVPDDFSLFQPQSHISINLIPSYFMNLFGPSRKHKISTCYIPDDVILEHRVDFASHTESRLTATTDGKFNYLPLGSSKPCMYVKSWWPNLEWRISNTNSIKFIVNFLVST